MKVLQFAFGENTAGSPHIPHHHERDFVVYTGTHDNNTTLGWYREELTAPARRAIRQYCGTDVHEDNICETMIRMAYASVAETAIVPMQDILKHDAGSRMNKPGTTGGNWTWRMPADEFDLLLTEKLRQLTGLYDR